MAEENCQQSLEIELELRNIPFLSKTDLEVAYEGQKLTTAYRPDLLVFNEIVVELKADKNLFSEHKARSLINWESARRASATSSILALPMHSNEKDLPCNCEHVISVN